MIPNLLEGFGDWLKTIGVAPKFGGDQHILLANVVLQPEDGSQPVSYRGMTMFKIVKIDPKARWAKIVDANEPDRQNPGLAQMPHAISPSEHAGRIYVVQGEEFDKLIQPQVSAQNPTMGAM